MHDFKFYKTSPARIPQSVTSFVPSYYLKIAKRLLIMNFCMLNR